MSTLLLALGRPARLFVSISKQLRHSDASVRVLYLLLALTLVRGVLYAVLNPPFGSPDERDHFQYVLHLATAGAAERGAEGHQPVPYYALMVPAHWLTAGQSDATQLLAIRLLSLPFLLGVVLFTWLAARKMAPDKPLVRTLATGFVALHPQLAYIGASANNDNAANFMGAVLTYIAVLLLSGNGVTWTLLPMSLAVGAALLTKGQILPMAALIALLVVGYATVKTSKSGRRDLLLYASLIILLVVAVFGTREGAHMLSISSTLISSLGNSATILGVAQRAGLEPLRYLNTSFWSAFQGESLRPENGWHLLLAAMVLFASSRCLVQTISRWTQYRVFDSSAMIRTMLALMAISVALSVYLRFLYSYQFVEYAWRLQVLQGRFLLVSLPPVALLTADGLSLTVHEAKLHYLAVSVLMVIFLFDLNSLTALITFHAWTSSS